MAAIGKEFEGQVAIVTGGADGLGKAIVRMLAENGAKVMIFDLAEEKLKVFVDELMSAGYDTRSCKVDVSMEASVKEGFSEFAKFSDRLDIMVNCAGIVGPNSVKSDSVTVEDFDRVYAGTILLCLPDSLCKNSHCCTPCLCTLAGRPSIMLDTCIAHRDGLKLNHPWHNSNIP